MTRQEASEWGCIVSGIVSLGMSIVWLFGVKPSGIVLPLIAIVAALACGTLFYLGKRIEKSAPAAEVGKPHLDALARKHGIYIGSGGIAAEVIDDILTVRLTIFTCTNIELRYVRASLFTGLAGLEMALESAEPHRLLPWAEFVKVFHKTLTAEEIKRVPEWADTVAINGRAKFEDHIETEFSIRSALYRRALVLSEPRTLRDTAIGLYDRLGIFMREYETKSQMKQEPGESGDDFVMRKLSRALQQNTQMAADFRIQFESEMRSLNDQIQARSGDHSLTAAIDQVARTCNAKEIEEMREHLWECARTMNQS